MTKLSLFLALIACGSVLSFSSEASDMMARPDCISGPNVNDALNKLDRRIVACHNYQNELRYEDYQRLAGSMDILAQRIRLLEQEVASLKAAQR